VALLSPPASVIRAILTAAFTLRTSRERFSLTNSKDQNNQMTQRPNTLPFVLTASLFLPLGQIRADRDWSVDMAVKMLGSGMSDNTTIHGVDVGYDQRMVDPNKTDPIRR